MDLEEALELVPPEHAAALEKAFAWSPRLKSWGYTVKKTMKAVKDGKKPLAYGFRDDVLIETAELAGLETDGKTAWLPGNEDMAALMQWVDQSGLSEKQGAGWIRGVLLGYPVPDIESYVIRTSMDLRRMASRIASNLLSAPSDGLLVCGGDMNLLRIAARVALTSAGVGEGMKHNAAVHQQGDPAADGWQYSCTLKPQMSTSTEKVFSVNGMYKGQVVSGQLTTVIENGVFAGYSEYVPDPDSFDFTTDEEALDEILGACQLELGSN